VAASDSLIGDPAQLPRLLYIGDVSVADTMAGEALLFRLLQFYQPEQLALVCGVRPDMPMLPGVQYHHWGPAFPRLLYSRVAEEYILWRAWRYYKVPAAIARIATRFKPEAILTISHVSAWLAAWQLAEQRRIPFHVIAHDDLVYSSRFPQWSRAWAGRKFGQAYRAAASRFCISDTMADAYQQRFGAAGRVIYPTFKDMAETPAINPRSGRPLTFGYGGSLNSASDIDQIVAFARVAGARGHRVMAYTPQYQLLSERAAAAGVSLDARAPIHSDEFKRRCREEADCLLLPQSLEYRDLPLVSTAFPSKWADYATLGLPVVVWAPPQSSSARFVSEHPGCAALVTSSDPGQLAPIFERLERAPDYRRDLAERLLETGRTAFSPQAAWQTFRSAITSTANRTAPV